MIEQTWRWYGPNDRITLNEIKQTGATGVVTALHHIPNGEVWTSEEILKRKAEIAEAGLSWSVVESVPVHEDIKKQSGEWKMYVKNYQDSIRNLGACGIQTICYNFMPVLDWSRTNLNERFEDGSFALSFEQKVFAAFDMYILQRKGAEKDYSHEIIAQADAYIETLSEADKDLLTETIIQGLPGAEESYTLDQLQAALDAYKDIDAHKLRQHLKDFLHAIIPVAELSGVKMAIHPDDPPWGLLGLPRVVSTLEDVKEIVNMVKSTANGITFCTGSWGAGYFNDLSVMAEALSEHIHFAHLRNVKRDRHLNFSEDYLFEGDVDMYAVLKVLIREEEMRKQAGRSDYRIPVRPDHGNQMLGDIGQENNPGYSLYGRMKGLAEIRGLEQGIRRSLDI